MGKKEITVLALASALLVTVHTVPVSAAEAISAFSMQTALAQLITPRWGSTNMVVPSISLSGKKISASVVIDPKESTTTSVGTLHLEKKAGNGWISAASWPIDAIGTVNMTKTYRGTAGVTYRTRVIATTGADEIDAFSTELTV